MRVCCLDYGAPVRIDVEPREDFHLVRQDGPHLVLRIPRDALERQLRAMLGRPVDEPVRFEPRTDRTDPGADAWWGIVVLLVRDMERGGTLLRDPAVRWPLEQALLGQLLERRPHNYSARLRDAASSPVITRAVGIIEERAGDPRFTVEELARAVSLSTRALQLGFRRDRRTTPSAFLRRVRLRRAREELLVAGPGVTVSRVAGRWGFSNYGRFAEYYRREFGELPSDTLRSR
ncbi:hypothetical protein SRB5_59670 [Streptomyces sp. RB5]|uniref:HTH araC/xylS-type domain-containing protein n=1 Tax=Streptomyces smaragdinus TaxID=2585196 RepID=A0A7K0CQM3_9ACTN|nr:helix-turn-helix transcriptional regulator [Streptomyces smaragdinus]MQY15776.1 hypothetical protein [Streptomyces smaragdinus]